MTGEESVLNFTGEDYEASSDDYVAHITGSLSTRESLFDALAGALKFPNYFGRNWDALSDCLRDLSWIKSRRVVIFHHEWPQLDEANLSTYLDILVECIRDWKPAEAHELVAVFPPPPRTIRLP
jgi:RNAse (barnase) inhibitor barstar